MLLPVHNISHSRINGPGNRLVIWVQGCKFHCKGCFNPETHPYTKEHLIDVVDLVKTINEDTSIEGITVSGGEPLDHPNQIQSLLTGIEKRITTIIYSGYRYEDKLRSVGVEGNYWARQIVSEIPRGAAALCFSSDTPRGAAAIKYGTMSLIARCSGLSVRPVRAK